MPLGFCPVEPVGPVCGRDYGDGVPSMNEPFFSPGAATNGFFESPRG